MGLQDYTVAAATAADPRFEALCTELDAALEEQVNGQFQRSVYAPHNKMDPASRVVLLVNENGAFGCGALRPLENGDVELKRVFVRKAGRCHGCGHAIVTALMEQARAEGFTRMVLETGRPLKNAMRLYTALGFSVIPNYGPYVGMDTSVCMAKAL